MTMASLEQDDPERPDVGFEPNLDPRLGGLGQDAVLVLVRGMRSVWKANTNKCAFNSAKC